MFKSRLEIQESLIEPSSKVKALLRIHLFSFSQVKQEDIPMNEDNNFFENYNEETNWILRVQGKVMNFLENDPGGFYRKFSYFFQKILIQFDQDNEIKYQDIEWSRNSQNPDVDGFEIKRKGNAEVKLKLIFYFNKNTQEVKVSEELAAVIGIKQDTRPRILHALWQYIKLNRLQDSENTKLIINNKEMQRVFLVDKMEISTIPSRLNDHLKALDPIEIRYIIRPMENSQETTSLYDLVVTIDNPHYLDITNFLSNIENESILFPKSLFYNKSEGQTQKKDQSFAEKFYNKIDEYDRNINDLIEKIKKYKYKI